MINTNWEDSVSVIQDSVEQLGFEFTDIDIILGSHAHADHMQGDALVKELTGGLVMAMAQDVAALERMRPGDKAHPIDRVLRDGDEVTLGGSTLVARLTPGHTKGCTTWTMTVDEDGHLLVKVLEVAKVRGAEMITGNIVSFDVEPGLGMRIIPISKVSV